MDDQAQPFSQVFPILDLQGGSLKTAKPAVYPTMMERMTYPFIDIITIMITTCKKAYNKAYIIGITLIFIKSCCDVILDWLGFSSSLVTN